MFTGARIFALPPTNAYLYDLQTEFAGRQKTLDVG